MPRTPDPLAGMTRLLVDGTDLLYALSRADGPLPPAAVVSRLRALVPAGIVATVVLDGTPAPGAINRRVTSGIEVRYSGKRPADALLVELAGMAPFTTLVVADDDELATSLPPVRRPDHAPTAGWRSSSDAGVSNRRPRAVRGPRRIPPAELTGDEGPARPGWNPGRAHQKKSGNPKRGRPSADRRWHVAAGCG